ncbi:similar to prolyl oligopeptidase [Botrytis cinerea T4]|uniref:Carboxylic ester hydrolase n=1 Tax=Botryotinia fuckeliana (strain T4) TaxID=999810 RepID=G2YQK4_BOTF4|nr:similar to prolyl oligopeptidase [Botrytis cinerea T4]
MTKNDGEGGLENTGIICQLYLISVTLFSLPVPIFPTCSPPTQSFCKVSCIFLTTVYAPLLAGLAASRLVSGAAIHNRASRQVTTSYGILQGGISELNSNVNVYKGIPFATPPTDELRWTAPTSPAPWSGVLNATTFGADCPQGASDVGLFTSGNTNIAEDCLYLNVWAPANATPTSKLPVYVWIYGGRFELGSGSVPTYDGTHLASKDIVVVTLNYRMGPFGFLAHPDLSAESGNNASGNYGLLDQIQALTFLRSEIAAFGGDPDHMTVGGQSAGSASALDMMYSPLTDGMIVGCIPESGARGVHDPETYTLATSHRDKDVAEAAGVDFLSTLNVTTIAELRNISMETLLEYNLISDTVLVGTAFENVSSFMEPPAWRPVIDGYVLPHNYGQSLSLNAHSDIPILTGNNADETGSGLALDDFTTQFTEMFGNLSTRFFDLYPATNDSNAVTLTKEMYRDLSRTSTWDWATAWYAGGAKSNVYVYYFTHSPPNQTEGVYHGAELWYAFGNIPTYYNFTWTKQDYALQDQMSGYWANFIKTGNPNGGSLAEFPATTSDVKQAMWLGDTTGSSYLTPSDDKFSFMQDFFAQQIEF